jgi:hypothetical protein
MFPADAALDELTGGSGVKRMQIDHAISAGRVLGAGWAGFRV